MAITVSRYSGWHFFKKLATCILSFILKYISGNAHLCYGFCLMYISKCASALWNWQVFPVDCSCYLQYWMPGIVDTFLFSLWLKILLMYWFLNLCGKCVQVLLSIHWHWFNCHLCNWSNCTFCRQIDRNEWKFYNYNRCSTEQLLPSNCE